MALFGVVQHLHTSEDTFSIYLPKLNPRGTCNSFARMINRSSRLLFFLLQQYNAFIYLQTRLLNCVHDPKTPTTSRYLAIR